MPERRRSTLAVTAIAALLVLAAVTLAAATSARADVVWLCKPGVEPDPCRSSLATTVYTPAGEMSTHDTPLPADPPIDCFYVYPTVSGQPSANANKDKDPELVAVARQQASRYSSECRVFAPVYRQQTLLALEAGGSAAALQLAYGDVAEAWRDYLAHENHGRGFVLLGHSQGTRMLRQLLRKEIDPNPEVRRRLVSAVLLGGNVTVKRGQLGGGDFQNVPACTSPRQTGCVIAFSTFNDTPPSNSRFGRVADTDTSGFGFPVGWTNYEVLCTNPASLGLNERAPVSTYLRTEQFPGLLGLLLIYMFGGPPPQAPTPWVQPQDHYTARCETLAGANVLMLEPIAGARTLHPSPDASWGLHLADANIALGDLVGVVAKQAQAYLQPKPVTKLKRRKHRKPTFHRKKA